MLPGDWYVYGSVLRLLEDEDGRGDDDEGNVPTTELNTTRGSVQSVRPFQHFLPPHIHPLSPFSSHIDPTRFTRVVAVGVANTIQCSRYQNANAYLRSDEVMHNYLLLILMVGYLMEIDLWKNIKVFTCNDLLTPLGKKQDFH